MRRSLVSFFQLPQQVDGSFGFPSEMPSKPLARVRCRKIVNGHPFIQLFQRRLTLVTVVQGGGQIRCPRLRSASRKYTRTRQWKSLRAICLGIFPEDTLTRRQRLGIELQTFAEGLFKLPNILCSNDAK